MHIWILIQLRLFYKKFTNHFFLYNRPFKIYEGMADGEGEVGGVNKGEGERDRQVEM